MPVKPLDGIRILEIAIQVAMPASMKLLAAMGAEVIKLEGMARPCGLRSGGPFPDGVPGTDHWNRGGYYSEVNCGKYGIGVDITSPEGQELCKELVKCCDVVAENFTPPVLKKFGLDYEHLRQVKPDLVMASITGFGHGGGPWEDYLAFGMNVEGLIGVAAVTGYPGEEPHRCGMAYIDDLAAAHCAFAILAALEYRDRTGKGQWIDTAMYEAGSLVPEAVFEYQMNGRFLPRLGNRHPWMAPHGIYRCLGDDAWVAIAVQTDAQWGALCGAMGAEEEARDERYADSAGRRRHHDALDALISRWTARLTPMEVAARLQAAGVEAGPVLNNAGLIFDPHLKERGFFQVVDHGDDGEHKMGGRPYPGRPWRLPGSPGYFERAAPRLGQHNHEVLRHILGMDDERIAGLERRGVIGDTPIGNRGVRQPKNQSPDSLVEEGRMQGWDPEYRERLSEWFGEPIG